MPLREEFEQNGNWLFKRRSWLPLILFFFGIVVIFFYDDFTYRYITNTRWGIGCFLISISGLVVRAITVGATPKGTSGRNTDKQIAESLNQTGIYSVVRHPLYLGNFLMWLGLFMFLGLWWFVIICSLIYWLYYERIMYAEEEFLRRNYAGCYEEWANQTPAFIPRFKGWTPSKLNFSVRNVLKREYNGMFAIIVCFVLLNAISNFFTKERLAVDKLWQIIFVIGLILFLVLRTLKKKTKVLDIAGR